jgi:hypothetical protein
MTENNEPKIQIPPQGQTQEEAAQTKQGKSPLEEAREARDQLKAENDRREAIMRREEEMYARNILSGKTDAGDLKLTPEQVKQKQAQDLATEMVSAFHKK